MTTKRLPLLALLALAAGLRADIKVNVTAKGPRVQDELFGQNWNVYEKSGDGSDPVYVANVRAMGAKSLRVPGGGYASIRAWDDITCGGKDKGWLVDHAGMLNFIKATGMEPYPIINFGGYWCDQAHGHAAAMKKAADWVRYLNVSPKAAYARYWEVGNEVYFDGDKSHTDGKTYGELFAKYAKAMKAVDPSIKLGFNLFESREPKKLPWNQAALKALKESGAKADFYAVHFYPVWLPKEAREAKGAPNWDKDLYADSAKLDAKILKNVDLVAENTAGLDQTLDEVFGKGGGRAPYWMTEFRSTLELKFVEWVDTLFCAQVLLELGRLGYQGSHIWALKNGFDKQTQADFGLLRTGANADVFDDNPKDSPRPAYYIYPFLSRLYGRQTVQASSEGRVRAWASLRDDGSLTLFLVNNDLSGAKQTASLDLGAFKHAAQAQAWFLEPAGTTVHDAFEPKARVRDISINSVKRPDPAKLPGPAKLIPAAAKFKVELPPLAMALIRIPALGGK